MNTKSTCPDCGVAFGQPHINECDVEPCSICGVQRIACECEGHDPMLVPWTGELPVAVGDSSAEYWLTATYEQARQRASKYEVHPPESPWSEGVELDAIYPQECYCRALEYLHHRSRWSEKHRLVHGQTSLALGGHAWVELPNGLVFDGVYQRFYRREDYYGEMALATAWYIYEAYAAMMLGAHLQESVGRWWAILELPMILNRPPIHIDIKYAGELLDDHYAKSGEAVLQKLPKYLLQTVAERCGINVTRGMRKAELVTAICDCHRVTDGITD